MVIPAAQQNNGCLLLNIHWCYIKSTKVQTFSMLQRGEPQKATALHCSFTEPDKAKHFILKQKQIQVIKPIQRSLARNCCSKWNLTPRGKVCCYPYNDWWGQKAKTQHFWLFSSAGNRASTFLPSGTSPCSQKPQHQHVTAGGSCQAPATR